MKNLLDLILIAGFLAVDFFFFHDIFKAGEVTTLPQYLTGILSLVVIAKSVRSLVESGGPRTVRA